MKKILIALLMLCCTICKGQIGMTDSFESTTTFIYSPGIRWTENKKQDSIVKIIIEGDTMEANLKFFVMNYQITMSTSAVLSAMTIILTLVALFVGIKEIDSLYDLTRFSAIFFGLGACFTYKSHYKNPGKAVLMLLALTCVVSNVFSFLN